jgi:pentatricopeptide repeat protein
LLWTAILFDREVACFHFLPLKIRTRVVIPAAARNSSYKNEIRHCDTMVLYGMNPDLVDDSSFDQAEGTPDEIASLHTKAPNPIVFDDDLDGIDDDDMDEEAEDEDDYDDVKDEDENVMFRPHNFAKRENWLEDATEECFDEEKLPLGSLTEGDAESMVGLMVAWSRKNNLEGALAVERLLKRIVDDMSAGNQNVFVSSRMYAITINAWARSGQEGAAERAQDIHDAMVNFYKQTGDQRLRPTQRSCNALLLAWARSGRPDAVKKGERLFGQMLNEWSDNKKSRPDATTIRCMLELYGNDGSKNALDKAERLFESVESFGSQKTASIYTALQNVYAKAQGIDAAKKTMEVVQRMMEDDSPVRPGIGNFNIVMNAYTRENKPDSARKAINLLQKMEQPVSDGGYGVAPDKMIYFLVILTCSRHPDINKGANLAERVLERMEDRARVEAKLREEISSVAPPLVYMDLECFNVVMAAISKSSDPEAFSRIFRIIQRMQNDYSNQNIQPSLRSWNAALNALSRQSTLEAATRAEKILNHLHQLYDNGKLKEKPDEFAYSSVLTAYQRLKIPEAAHRAEALLMRMEDLYERSILDKPPDVVHHTIVCSIWAETGLEGGPERCAEHLQRMTKRYKEGFRASKPTTRMYNSVLDCYSRGGQPERAEQLLYYMLSLARKGDRDARPDAASFDITINGFLRSRIRDAGRRAESVLERGLEFAEEEGGQMLDIRSFTAILGYYGQQTTVTDSPYRAEYVLNRLVSLFQAGHNKLSPHISCFTSVMDAYAAQKNSKAGECAESLLRTMIRLKRDYSVQKIEINSGVMNSVLKAWEACAGSDNAGERAERILDLMEEKCDGGNAEMAPNFSSYHRVIGTWSKSSSPNKVDRAVAAFNRMKQRSNDGKLSGRIPEHAYALVINACAFSNVDDPEESLRTFNIARNMFEELILESEQQPDRAEPSPTTYGWYIQALGQAGVSEDLKFQTLKEVFDRCCKKQRISPFVWEKLKAACTSDELAQLLLPLPKSVESKTKRVIRLADLPEKWIWKGHPDSDKTAVQNYVRKWRRRESTRT